jgi:hypothetical protein
MERHWSRWVSATCKASSTLLTPRSGILVEEHVKRQLDAMGYQRREDVQRSAGSEDELAVDEGDANDSGDND